MPRFRAPEVPEHGLHHVGRMRLPTAVALVFVACSFLHFGCGDASSRPDAASGDGGGGSEEASRSGSSGGGSGSSGGSGGSSGGEPAADAGVPDTGSLSDGLPIGNDAAATDASGDALPPGTVSASGLDDSMTKIANGGADQCKTVGAHKYCGGLCDGTCAGTQTDSIYAVQTGNATPSLDGASTRVDVSNPGTDAGTDTLEWIKLDPAVKGAGAYADDTHFRWVLDFYPTSLDIQAYEFDLFYSSNGWWLMMGTQCNLASGNWNGWNQRPGTGSPPPSTAAGRSSRKTSGTTSS